MNREDIENWVRAAREHPVRSAFLLLAALALAFLFGFAGETGKIVAGFVDLLTLTEPAIDPGPAISRSMPLSDWLDFQRNGDSS